MGRVGGEYNATPSGLRPHYLQPRRVSAGSVNFDPGHDLLGTSDETQPAPEVFAYEVQHVVGLDQGTELLSTGVTAGPERHLLVLNDERGRREVFEVPDMVV